MSVTTVVFEKDNLIIEATILDEAQTNWISAQSDTELYGNIEVLTCTVVDRNTDQIVDESEIDIDEIIKYYESYKETRCDDFDVEDYI